MRHAVTVLAALTLAAAPWERARAAQVCAWIVETIEDDGAHMFKLTLSVDAPASVAVRFHGANFTSASMGGDLIALDPGEPKEVDGAGFDVGAGDDLDFDVRLYDHPLASLEAMRNPAGKPLTTFVFHGKAGADGHAPADALAKQCQPLG